MLNPTARCEGALIGHAITSLYDPSIFMALNVSDSLIACRKFDGSDILSRHLYLYHTTKSEIGEITKYIYQASLQRIGKESNLTRENFVFNESVIKEMVQLADKNANGHTAGCSPAHRSYPMAFCQFISDDDLFDSSLDEAKLTHQSPLAGQVAGIVNLICRSLLRDKTWNEAVQSAFKTPRLHDDLKQILLHHHRRATPIVEVHPAYAPTVLHVALHHLSGSESMNEAMKKAEGKYKFHCLPIVGVLAGARWGVTIETLKNNIEDSKLKTIRETAAKLSNIWNSQNDHLSA